jgi:adsorption protein B
MTQFATDFFRSPSTLEFFSRVHEHAATLLMVTFIGLLAGYLISGLDDFFVDAVAWLKMIRPNRLSKRDMDQMNDRAEKMLAVIVPAWDEGSIIERMIVGNLGRIEYSSYHFFIGCYPNDSETVTAVKKLESCYPRVHCIINFQDGPTSKGQILNWVVDSILDWERCNLIQFDGFLMHDSEDLIHPKSLKLVNWHLERNDFIQIPVFSLQRSHLALVAGVYIDEFSESHTKDMLVRSFLGGPIPSAGVGTCMSRSFVMNQKLKNGGYLFNSQCLTEDYELGVVAGLAGIQQDFVASTYRNGDSGNWELIATREFFPKSFRRSIRQKTRWTLGIALQSWRSIGWPDRLVNRYFLMRDRKGLVTNPLMILGYIWIFAAAVGTWAGAISLDLLSEPRMQFFVGVAGFFAVNRVLQRMICVSRVYGFGAAFVVPIRLPLGNVINGLAVINAVYKDTMARITRRNLDWVKTTHELPEDFGQPASTPMKAGTLPMAADGGTR